jgi:hypothetical protein
MEESITIPESSDFILLESRHSFISIKKASNKQEISQECSVFNNYSTLEATFILGKFVKISHRTSAQVNVIRAQ